MDWDDELDGMIHGADSAGSMLDQGSGSALDPINISDPASAYFLLSDEAQDEITRTDKKKMKCRVCGHRFTGEIHERCPKCDSLDTYEALPFLDDNEDRPGKPNMKCLDCGHTFVGEIYDRCPKCLSIITEAL
jgi:predicted Zn-ribbon and HTH transcriptional regulator